MQDYVTKIILETTFFKLSALFGASIKLASLDLFVMIFVFCFFCFVTVCGRAKDFSTAYVRYP